MQQHLQDALAINHFYEGGDLFVTMTANPNWPEIKDALFPGQSANKRPNLVVRVFHAKLTSLIKEIRRGVLGNQAAHLYTIEFQKCGLPHAHIIVFLQPQAKLCTLEDIDSLMSSKFPTDNDDLLELIQSYMIHRPCGNHNPNALCIMNGECSKGFSKPLREETSVTEDSYACTRRCNTGQTYRVGDYNVDNKQVVCYLPYLIQKYRCYINVKLIASVKAVKYIYCISMCTRGIIGLPCSLKKLQIR